MPNPKLETYKNKATNTVYDFTDPDAQSKLTSILDGTDIDSFGDVEGALATKTDLTVVAPEYSSGASYQSDDLVILANELKRYDGGAEPWANTTVAEEIQARQLKTTFDSGDFSVMYDSGGGHDKCHVDLNKDSTPTQNSTKTLESGGAYTALQNKASKDNVIANTQLIADTVGFSAKNKFKYNRVTVAGSEKTFPFSVNNLTVSRDSDDAVSVGGGIASATTQIFLWLDGTITAGDYILSGCPSGGGSSKYDVRTDNNHKDEGNGVNITLASDVGSTFYVVLTVYSGCDLTTPIKFKTMIRDANIIDPTYEPYHKESVKDMVELVDYSSQCTGETGAGFIKAYKIGRVAYIQYQGADASHADNDQIITLPEALRPLNYYLLPVNIPQASWTGMLLGESLKIKVSKSSNSTVTGRICFTTSYVTYS